MGIGRKEFLKIFGSVIATAITNPLQAILLDEDLYLNRALGVAFRKPEHWFYMSVKEFSNLKHKQILKDDEFTDQLRGAVDPIVVMTKVNPQNENKIGPSITIYVEPFQLEEGESLIEFLPDIESLYQNSLKNYKHIGKPIETSISNCETVEYFSEFLFEHSDFKIMARNRSVISVREPQLITINMFDYPESNFIAQNNFDDFLKSVHYV